MNKTKMGRFLKQLRESKKLSQEKLADKFREAYFEVSINAISSWENGKTVPDIDKLIFLCDFYKITIDDILNGEKYEEIDFDQIYHMHQNDYFTAAEFASHFKDEKNTNAVYKYITDEGVVIRSRFKEHILSLINGTISRVSLKELSFFLKHYYILAEDMSISSYFSFLRKLKRKKTTIEEKWWEAQRYVFPFELLRLSFSNVCDEGYKYETNQKRMDYSEKWEKDMLLSMIQFNDAVSIDPNDYSSKFIERYEKEHGKQFDREQLTKDAIRYLINNGAMINREFLSYPEGEAHSVRIIDSLERAYDAIAKPLRTCVNDGQNTNFFYAENNAKNRLFIKYDYEIVRPLRRLGYTYDEIFNLVSNNERMPDEVYLKEAELKGIDTNREKRFVVADAKMMTGLDYVDYCWQKYYTIENVNNLQYRDDLELLGEDLSNGHVISTHIETTWFGGITVKEKVEYVLHKKPSMTYSDFVKGRQPNRTKQLLESLDSMTVEQIREKFFQIGGQEND